METSNVVIMVLTNLIMLLGGYYLGISSEKEKAVRVMEKVIMGCAMFMAVGDTKKKFKKEKNAKSTGRV